MQSLTTLISDGVWGRNVDVRDLNQVYTSHARPLRYRFGEGAWLNDSGMVEGVVLSQFASYLHILRGRFLVVIAVIFGWLSVPQVAADTWSCADDAPTPVYPSEPVPSMVAVYLSEHLGQGPPAQGVSRADISSLARNMYDATGRQYVVVGVVGAENINTFDAFGILIASTGSTFNRFLYCGEEWDANLNLYYNRARWMEPGRGRFWNSDTFEGFASEPGSLHKYLYCQGDPVNFHDRSGHDLTEMMAVMAIGAVIGGTSAAVGDYALGRAITVSSVVTGAALGAAFALGAWAAPVVGIGLAAGGIVTSSVMAYVVFNDPAVTGGREAAALGLVFASVFGAVGAQRGYVAGVAAASSSEGALGPAAVSLGEG